MKFSRLLNPINKETTIKNIEREFTVMEKTYKKIFTRLGLDFRVVQVGSSQIAREDIILCDYGISIEILENPKIGVL